MCSHVLDIYIQAQSACSSMKSGTWHILIVIEVFDTSLKTMKYLKYYSSVSQNYWIWIHALQQNKSLIRTTMNVSYYYKYLIGQLLCTTATSSETLE
jgi:hypothetical protein